MPLTGWVSRAESAPTRGQPASAGGSSWNCPGTGGAGYPVEGASSGSGLSTGVGAFGQSTSAFGGPSALPLGAALDLAVLASATVPGDS